MTASSAYEVTDDDLYRLPEGTVLWKPKYGGWTLFIKEEGTLWRCVDAYDRDARGRRYTADAVGTHSPGYVIHQPPALGYYEPPMPASGDSGTDGAA